MKNMLLLLILPLYSMQKVTKKPTSQHYVIPKPAKDLSGMTEEEVMEYAIKSALASIKNEKH